MRYKIKTRDDKIILCDDEESLRKTLPKLKDNVVNVEPFTTRSRLRKNKRVFINFTTEQVTKYTAEAKKIGCKNLPELIRLLLMVHAEIGIINRGDGIH